MAVDFTPVGTVESVGVNALAVAPVSLMADGMLPSRTPDLVLSFCFVFLSSPLGAVLILMGAC